MLCNAKAIYVTNVPNISHKKPAELDGSGAARRVLSISKKQERGIETWLSTFPTVY